ncbi:GDSL-type esterase/lipase family protein [Bacteroidales bacterium OttesenSCG-928-M06]|nr:GDSL-type esterase/lipase family protein [Bacteroidales bacterium OttesenSCG-928-M06]
MRKYIFVIIALGFSLQIFGQRSKLEIAEVVVPDYPFIKKDYNIIQVPGKDSTRLNQFFHKIDTLLVRGEGRINILHIGGSHVQADMFSHQVRQNLDAINGEFQAPRGFIFPYTIAKTNNPTSYKVSYTGKWDGERNVKRNREKSLGVGGITVYTGDPEAQIEITLNPDSTFRWDFDRLRLMGYVEDGSCMVTPVLYWNNDTIEGLIDLMTDTYVFELPEPDYSFSVGFIQQDTIPHTFIVNGFVTENETPGIVYHSIGINGASVPSYLGCEDFEKELAVLNPDLVIFGIGINDATAKDFKKNEFKQNYAYLLEMIERVNPDCAFLFITNNDSFRKVSRKKYVVNPNGTIARKAFFELAEEYQGGVWDLFSLMGGLNSMRKWQNAKLARVDKVHFTKAGYTLIGDMMYNALVNYYKQID